MSDRATKATDRGSLRQLLAPNSDRAAADDVKPVFHVMTESLALDEHAELEIQANAAYVEIRAANHCDIIVEEKGLACSIPSYSYVATPDSTSSS